MSDPVIFPVKPGSLKPVDKAALRNAGVIVVEHDDPDSLRLLRPTVDLDASAMLVAAIRAIRTSGDTQAHVNFTRILAEMLEATYTGPCNKGTTSR